jgi:cellulose synthase/poly-beta-1,6-N-acetylglucosamine synthase-like glycosyltransferase
MNYKVIAVVMLMLMVPAFAISCGAAPVCTTLGANYGNQTLAESAGKVVAYCGVCATGQSPCTNNGTTSQYGNDSSFLERYMSCSMNQLIGNSSVGNSLLGLLIGMVMSIFIMMQNTRFDGKILGFLVTGVLVSLFVGWIIWIMSLVIGVILYFGLWKRLIEG